MNDEGLGDSLKAQLMIDGPCSVGIFHKWKLRRLIAM